MHCKCNVKHVEPITLLLKGGLGNQLFQFAAGLFIEKQTNRPVQYSDVNFRLAKLHHKISGTTQRALEIGDLISSHKFVKNPVSQLVNFKAGTRRGKQNWICENTDESFCHWVDKLPPHPCIVDGYFQDQLIVESVENEFFDALKKSPFFHLALDGPVRNLVTLHIRLGDYVSNESARVHHGLTSWTYFDRSLQYLSNIMSFSDVDVVSDQPMEAKKYLANLSQNPKYKVQFSPESTPSQDFARLSSSRALVISNSSFSWWAAWVASKLHGSSVVFPTPWLASPTVADKLLCLPTWSKVERACV